MTTVGWDEVVEATCGLLRRRLEARDATAMAMLAELLVARLLPGAIVSEATYSQGWDLVWDGRRIEVKASGRRPPVWTLRRGTSAFADLYVFADYSAANGTDGWRWWVAPTAAVVGRRTWSPTGLSGLGIGPAGCDGLLDAVAGCQVAPRGVTPVQDGPRSGSRRNLTDEALDDLVRRLRQEGVVSATQISRRLRGTPSGTNAERIKASLARVASAPDRRVSGLT